MIHKKLPQKEISKAREIVDTSERPYLAWKKIDLINSLSFQESVVDDFIHLLLIVTRQNDLEPDISVEGLFFAFERYKDLVEEIEMRLHENQETA